jgi:hypothetical protein
VLLKRRDMGCCGYRLWVVLGLIWISDGLGWDIKAYSLIKHHLNINFIKHKVSSLIG